MQTTRRRNPKVRHQKRADLECPTCHRCFARPEHLVRHQRVHDGVQPFRCSHPGCERQFNRQDSLARHAKLHSSERTSHGSTSQEVNGLDEIGDEPVLAQNTQQGMTPRPLGLPETMATDVAVASQFDGSCLIPADCSSFETLWLGSEDLFTLLTSHPSPWDMSSLPPLDLSFVETLNETQLQPLQQPPRSSARARQAMQHLDNLIKDISLSLSKEVERLGVTGDFLDTCLSMFFTRFVSVFPVIHQPTFSVRDCTPPLLLNMIALGSLFVATDGAIARGESLWKLAHTATATNWQSMLLFKGAEDAVPGVQLVMTAFLGQAYALLSANRSIRLTSYVFHALGFYWARLSSRPCPDAPPTLEMLTDTAEAQNARWRKWASVETCHRALLGHYILDGLISQMSGLPSSVRHTTNNMPLPHGEHIFTADNAGAWIQASASAQNASQPTVKMLIRELFSDENHFTTRSLPHMCLPVLLEALQSLRSEINDDENLAVGLPTLHAICQALWRLYDRQIVNSAQLPDWARIDLSIRWHVICAGTVVPPSTLVRGLCNWFNLGQDLFPQSGPALDVSKWRGSASGRMATLHALTVVDLMKQMPLAKLQALHLPLALLTAEATLLAMMAASGIQRILVPAQICWQTVLLHPESIVGQDVYVSSSATSTASFLTLGSVPAGGQSTARNLMQDVLTLHQMLESLALSWGIAKDMCALLRRIVAMSTS